MLLEISIRRSAVGRYKGYMQIVSINSSIWSTHKFDDVVLVDKRHFLGRLLRGCPYNRYGPTRVPSSFRDGVMKVKVTRVPLTQTIDAGQQIRVTCAKTNTRHNFKQQMHTTNANDRKTNNTDGPHTSRPTFAGAPVSQPSADWFWLGGGTRVVGGGGGDSLHLSVFQNSLQFSIEKTNSSHASMIFQYNSLHFLTSENIAYTSRFVHVSANCVNTC